MLKAILYVHLSVCPSLSLSHSWSMHRRIKISQYFSGHSIARCFFMFLVSVSKFRNREFMGLSQKSALQRGIPLSKAKMWAIIHNHLKTVWDRMWVRVTGHFGSKTFRQQDTSAALPKCPWDTSAVLPKYPDTSVMLTSCVQWKYNRPSVHLTIGVIWKFTW